jgi:hypothetical protein
MRRGELVHLVVADLGRGSWFGHVRLTKNGTYPAAAGATAAAATTAATGSAAPGTTARWLDGFDAVVGRHVEEHGE